MSINISRDRLFGPATPDLGWVPAPRYLLRRRRILEQLRDLPATELLEIGPGAGALLQELAAMGFSCHALETSLPARRLIAAVSKRFSNDIALHDTPSAEWESRFPLVMAFEVLEHIEDDAAAMHDWANWLRPGGTLLFSVPAHPAQWNAADVWAGHFRRYRKRELVDIVCETGLELEHIECMGFPLANVTERLQARGIEREQRRNQSAEDRQSNNDKSGIDREHVMRWYPLMTSAGGRLALRCAFAAQWLTRHLPLGNSYLVRARKPA